ncbi:MAG: UbiA family prenyltransferase [Thermoanaerobaculia bacterium]
MDNKIEGIYKNEYSSYPVPPSLFFLKILRIILYTLGIFLAFIFSKNSFPWVLSSIFLSIIYNNHKLSLQQRPPLDSILHFSGSFVFTISGGVWDGSEFSSVFPYALSLSLLFTGGYWNHLLLDKEKDMALGRKTMAHKIKNEIIKGGSIIFISSGDLFLGFFLGKKSFIFLLTFSIAAFFIIFFGLINKNPVFFRKTYRTIHFFLGLILILLFGVFF